MFPLLFAAFFCFIGTIRAASLTGFDADFSFGKFTLYFDEDVDPTYLNASQFGLQSSEVYNSSLPSFNFSGSFESATDLALQGNASTVYFHTTYIDFVKLIQSQVGLVQNSTYLWMTDTGALTTARGAVDAVTSGAALLVSAYVADNSLPYMNAFDFNMDNGLLSMNWSKPILSSTFTMVGLSFQENSNSYVGGEYLSMVNSDDSGVVATYDYDRLLVVQLGATNLDAMKATQTICSLTSTCYLSCHTPFLQDARGNNNSLYAFDVLVAVQVTDFIPDQTNPFMVSWILDFAYGVIRITYSETVLLISYNFSAIILQTDQYTISNSTYNTSSFRIMNPLNEETQFLGTDPDVTTMVIELEDIQLNEIKGTEPFQFSSNRSWLSIEPLSCTDTAYYPNSFQGTNGTVKAASIVPDVDSPTITGFTLNMTSSILTLQFSEIVRVSSINLPSLSIQSQVSTTQFTQFIVFSSDLGDVLNDKNAYPTIDFQFNKAGIGAIKSLLPLAQSITSVFVTSTALFITDMAFSRNPVVAISAANALACSSYFPDYNRPVLEHFGIDMAYNRLRFTFSVPIDDTSFDPTQYMLQSTEVVDVSTISVSLTDTSTVYNYDLYNIYLQLGAEDVNSVKSAATLCRTNSSCFLSITEMGIANLPTYLDDGNITVTRLVPVTVLPQDNYTKDTMPPSLVSWGLDVNEGLVYLSFNDPVQIYNIDPSLMVIYDFFGNPNRLSTDSYAIGNPSVDVIVKLSLNDFITIKAISGMTVESLSLYLDAECVQDMSDNYNLASELVDGGWLGATTFVDDVTAPALVAIYANFSTYTLNVIFSDAMNIEKTNLEGFVMQSAAGTDVILSSGVISNEGTSTGTFQISYLLAFSTLTNAGFVFSQEDTYFYVSSVAGSEGTSRDTYDNYLTTGSSANVIRDGNIPDNFRIDMTLGLLTLEMVYPIVIGSFDPTGITISQTSSAGSGFYTLTGSENVTVSDSGFLIVVNLLYADILGIQVAVPITSTDSIELAVDVATLIDDNGKELSRSLVIPCTLIRTDTIAPYLISFNLDVGLGTLTLLFSEPIVTVSIVPSLLTLMSERNAWANNSIQLTQSALHSSMTASFSTTVILNIDAGTYPTDKDNILFSETIAVDVNSTYLKGSQGFAYDSSLPTNVILAITTDVAMQVNSLIVNKIKPYIVSFDLDMNTRLITIYYSATVNKTTNDPTMYTLLENPDNANSAQFTFTNQTFTNIGDSPTDRFLTMTIAADDINAIMFMSPSLAQRQGNSHISVVASAVLDISRSPNGLDATLFRYGVQVTTFTPDTTPPILLSFDFSLEDGSTTFYFDEVMDCTFSNITFLYLQYAAFAGTSDQQMTLNSENSYVDCPSRYSLSISFVVTTPDLLIAKAFTSLLKSADTSYCRPIKNCFFDASMNPNDEVFDGSALQVSTFTEDSIAPNLLSFTVTSQKVIFMTFDEPVNTDTMLVSGFIFQNGYPTFTISYALSTAVVIGEDSLKQVIEVSLVSDYNTITGGSTIFQEQSSTYLRALATAIKDTSGNELTPIPYYEALSFGPSIVSFKLNLDSGLLTLDFTEAVNATFSTLGLLIQTASNLTVVDTLSYALTTTTLVNLTASTTSTYTVTLSTLDVNSLKYDRIGVSMETTYLSAVYGMTHSLSSGTIIPLMETVAVRDTTALLAAVYIADSSPPICTYFDLDLNIGTLFLKFDEPIEESSVIPTNITLISSSVGSVISLTGSVAVNVSNVTGVTISLNMNDLNNIKIQNVVGLLDSMLFAAGGAKDIIGNPTLGNTETSPVPLNNFTADTSNPVLTYALLNFSSNLLVLSYDEFVLSSSVKPYNIKISVNSSFPDDDVFVFTNFSIIQSSGTNGDVILDYSTYRFDFIDLRDYLATNAEKISSAADVYISVSKVEDIAGNKDEFDSSGPLSQLYPDQVSPCLEAFDLEIGSDDTSLYNASFYFSKPVNYEAFTCSDFILHTHYNPTNSSNVDLQLQNSDCTKLDQVGTGGRIVKFTFPVSIVTAVSDTLGVDFDFTYLRTITSPTSTDTGLSNILKRSTFSLRVGPAVVAYVLDMEQGTVSMLFSKDLSISSTFNPNALGFYSDVTGERFVLEGSETLEGYFSTSPDLDSIATVTLSDDDFTSVKLLDVQEGKVALLIGNDMMYDNFGVPVVFRSPLQRLDAARFFVDDVRPTLTNITFFMGIEQIKIDFDEPIVLSSVKVENFIIQSSSSSMANSYQLTGGVLNFTRTTLLINWSKKDAEIIQLQAGLAKNLSTTFISFTYSTLNDIAGNPATSIATTSARAIDFYLPDTQAPFLRSFDLNMHTGKLTFHFSEPVSVASLIATELFILSSYSLQGGGYLQLTGGSVESVDSSEVVVAITADDIYTLKSIVGLVRFVSSSFLIFSDLFVTDVFGNAITPISNGRAMPCSIFTKDSHRPSITAMHFIMNTFSIIFEFDELVILGSASVLEVSIQEEQSVSTNSYTFTSSSYVAEPYSYNLTATLEMAQDDLNAIKNKFPLGSGIDYTWVIVGENFITDVYGNLVNPIPSSAGVQLATYQEDTIPPIIISYVMDMNKGLMKLEYNESLASATFTETSVTMQNIPVRRFGVSQHLVDSVVSFGTGSNSFAMNISFSYVTLNSMKYQGIGADKKSSLLSYLGDFVADNADNYVLAKFDASVRGFTPLVPTTFIADTTSPYIVKWFIDYTTGYIHVVCSEACLLGNTTDVTLNSDRNGTAALNILEPYIAALSYVELHVEIVIQLITEAQCIEYDTAFNASQVVNASTDLYDALVLGHRFYHDCVGIGNFWRNTLYNENPLNLDFSFVNPYYLSLGASGIKDYAKIPNYVPANTAADVLLQGAPDCSLCPDGYYVSAACTVKSDRVCSACTSCSTNSFASVACSDYQDALCQKCATCPFGMYVSSGCAPNVNTECSTCVECSRMEYVSQDCVNGLDRVCESCEQCSFSDASIAVACMNDLYKWWYDENCCLDDLNRYVVCKDRSLQNMRINAAHSRHHWVFENSRPLIDFDNYPFGENYDNG